MQNPVRVTSETVHDQRREAGMQGMFALPQGRAVTVRPVSSEDREALGAMLSPLSARTIYERFHAPYPSVPAWALAGMVEADHDEKEALVAVAGEEIVGHAMYVRTGNGREAEFAVVVQDGWRSRGIGRLLLTVLGENRRALAAQAAVLPEMRYVAKDGSYQVRAPLGSPPHGERAA
jgi:GNAT superfamily N-acetyltransferase